jgi:type IV pilus assembly protein PilV
MARNQGGFTIVEVIVAIIVLTVGLLGLVTTSALVTRMIARGNRSSNAATFASKRLEQLRVTGCTSQAAGRDTLYAQSGVAVATNAGGSRTRGTATGAWWTPST